MAMQGVGAVRGQRAQAPFHITLGPSPHLCCGCVLGLPLRLPLPRLKGALPLTFRPLGLAVRGLRLGGLDVQVGLRRGRGGGEGRVMCRSA